VEEFTGEDLKRPGGKIRGLCKLSGKKNHPLRIKQSVCSPWIKQICTDRRINLYTAVVLLERLRKPQT
jgi:hypothetical protein